MGKTKAVRVVFALRWSRIMETVLYAVLRVMYFVEKETYRR
jgi:hypothetical protein